VAKLTCPIKRHLLSVVALVISATGHYFILKSSASPEINHSAKQSSQRNASAQALFTRILENTQGVSEVQTNRMTATPPASEQISSSQNIFNEKSEHVGQHSLGNDKNPRKSQEDLKGFYTFEEVDQPALPKEDWEIPLKSIGAMGIKFLVLRVWITDQGDVRHIEILSSTPRTLVVQDQEKLEKALLRTKMTPAIKGGRRVLSQRTIEMALEL
jgi:hypothetical protein